MSDLIDRQAAIDTICKVCDVMSKKEQNINCPYYFQGCKEVKVLRELPSVSQPQDCSTCKHNNKEFDDEPCDECCYGSYNPLRDDNKYEPQENDKTVSLDAVLKEIGRWEGYLDEDMITRIQTGIKKIERK